MEKIILVILVLMQAYASQLTDFSKIDYCKYKCDEPNDKSSNCKEFCKAENDRTEIVSDLDEFRQMMVDVHNDLRNKIANGSEKERGFPSAANMQALSYDMELEYLVRCYILSSRYQGDHDTCRIPSYCGDKNDAGQNLYMANLKIDMETTKKAVMKWYNELSDIEKVKKPMDIIKRFEYVPNTGHFTQLVWGRHNRLGCVRVWSPKMTNPIYRFTLACNYAASSETCSGNIITYPVYEEGTPCSKCGSSKCNSETPGGKYKALCGEIKAIVEKSEDRKPQNVSSQNGKSQKGKTQNGKTHKGKTHKGKTQNGKTQNEKTQEGNIQDRNPIDENEIEDNDTNTDRSARSPDPDDDSKGENIRKVSWETVCGMLFILSIVNIILAYPK